MFRNKLTGIDWDFEKFENISEKFKYFHNYVEKTFRSSFPIKTKTNSINHMCKPCITNAMNKSIKTRS